MDLLIWREKTSPSFTKECQRERERARCLLGEVFSHSCLQKFGREHCKVHF